MTEQERIELLKEVARVAPKEMGAHFMEDRYPESRPMGIRDDFTRFASLSVVVGMKDDVEDGSACFAMLDAMCGKGIQLEIRIYPPSSGECRPCVIPYLDSTGERFFLPPDDHFIGDTLTEAATRAFVAVFSQ